MSEATSDHRLKHRGHGGFGARFGRFEKAKDFKGTLKRLAGYFKPEAKRLIFVAIAAILGTVFNILGPKILGKAVTKLFNNLISSFAIQARNQIIKQQLAQNPSLSLQLLPVPGIEWGYIGRIMLTLLVLYLFSALFIFIQQYLMSGVAQRTIYKLRNEVDEKLHRLPLKYFDSRTHGEILSRAVNDMDNLGSTLQQSVSQTITSTTTLIGVLIMMLSISWRLTLIVLATVPLTLFIVGGIAKRSQIYFRNQQKSLGDLNGHVEEMYTGHKIIKAFGHEETAITEFIELNNRLYRSSWRAQFVSGIILPLTRFVGNLGYILVAVAGGVMATQGMITLGDVQAFIQYASQFTQPIAQIATITNIIQSAIASAERVFELLDEKEQTPEVTNPVVIKNIKGAVKFDHIYFGYSHDNILIKDMNIDVKPGQMVAIVGPTGAGKTTLVNLLMRFYEVNSGRILIDGVDITQMRRCDLHRLFGMVLQDTWLFHGPIRDNIAYGREGATEAEIIKAAEMAYADHFIRTLPKGYNMVINEEATNISQGQKQLLTIARAFLANPKILILDEATSSVDTRTEQLIQNAMEKLMKGRTSFVIAHRLSTIRNADLILVMNHGTIIEKGTHRELLAANGFYADLYNSQFSD
ncbi:MAG TPA: ABC transporter ATP-binding protein [Candidatus Woesebacteria bacterium]|nr:ABC transporter ATP-binding protein [Candidatus Woesebacteria bacterium]HRT40049.1 ABC transporter ATP-binding protein [Candidatus Woesebacteria bacterium]